MSDNTGEVVEAVGADFEPIGNEDRLFFAWPIVQLGDRGLYLAEGADWTPEAQILAGPISGDELDDRFATLHLPVFIRPGQGFLVIGPGYLRSMPMLGDPAISALYAVAKTWVSDSDGFVFFPTSQHAFDDLAMGLAQQAMRRFDDSLIALGGGGVSEAANAALRMFESDPGVAYEKRVIRRLLALRLNREWERYQSVLLRAARRLGLSEDEVERMVVDSVEILSERIPFERAVRKKAEEEFIAIAARVRATETEKQLEGDGAMTAIAVAMTHRESPGPGTETELQNGQ